MKKYKSHCKVCKAPWIPDSRHVDLDGCVRDCVPSDNLEYLELIYDRKNRVTKGDTK